MNISSKTSGKGFGHSAIAMEIGKPGKQVEEYKSRVRDVSLAQSGERKLAWAWRYMPLLQDIKKE